MKRGEMVNYIIKKMEENGYVSPSVSEIEDVLHYIEEAGMQPPAIKEPCNTFVLHNGQYIKTEDSFIFTNKWDAE